MKQLYYIPKANKASKELRAAEGKNGHIVTHVYIPKEKIRYNNKIGEKIDSFCCIKTCECPLYYGTGMWYTAAKFSIITVLMPPVLETLRVNPDIYIGTISMCKDLSIQI